MPAPAVAAPPVQVVSSPRSVVTAAESAGVGRASAGFVVGQVLPIYFVGDESHSMAGDPIAAVNQGLLDLRDGWRKAYGPGDEKAANGDLRPKRLEKNRKIR